MTEELTHVGVLNLNVSAHRLDRVFLPPRQGDVRQTRHYFGPVCSRGCKELPMNLCVQNCLNDFAANMRHSDLKVVCACVCLETERHMCHVFAL